jgi:hypothetical protein
LTAKQVIDVERINFLQPVVRNHRIENGLIVAGVVFSD